VLAILARSTAPIENKKAIEKNDCLFCGLAYNGTHKQKGVTQMKYRTSRAPRSPYAYKRTASYRRDKEAAYVAQAIANYNANKEAK